MSLIREAVEADIPLVVEMCRRFHAQTRYAEITTFDADVLTDNLKAWMGRDDVAVFIADNGDFLILGTMQPHFCRERIAIEVTFWAPGGHGTALRRAGEEWARTRAVAVTMDAHEPGPVDRIARWYARGGYRPLGQMHMKAL